MEVNPSVGPSVSDSQHITLNILSPSTEVPNKITFKDCAASTTVAELKAKICHAVPTKPAPERQRLIYRGRPLIQDTATLRDVLTQEAVRSSTHFLGTKLMKLQINTLQEFSVHLVLPPSIPHRNPQPSSIPPSPSTQGLFHPNAPQTGRMGATTHQQGAQGGQGGVPHMPFMPHQGGQHGPLPVQHGPIPPHIQNALQNHLQMLGQQIGAQIAMQGNHPMAQGMLNPNHLQNTQQQISPQASFQQVIAQQQQARAAAGHQGAGNSAAGQNTTGISDTSGQGVTAPTAASNPANTNVALPNTNALVQENRGPNGEGWRMVIQSTSTVSGLNPNMQRAPTPVNLGIQQSPAIGAQPAPAAPIGPTANQPLGHGPSGPPNQMQLRILEQELTAIQAALARGTAPAPSVFEAARTTLRNIENINVTPGLEAMLRTQLEGLSRQADQLRASLNNMLMRVVSEHPSPDTAPQISPAQTTPPHSTVASSVYVLSSPNGPQALLVSPSGMFSTPWNLQPHGNAGLPLVMHHYNHHPTPTHPTDNNNNNNDNDNGPPGPQLRVIPANAAQAPQQPQAQANEVRDLLRLLLPLGGHVWLLIRLFGFVYFFTAGGGSRRAFLLGGIAFLVFVAQTRVFRPVIQAVWDPLRRHVEGLVAGNDQNPAEQPAPPANSPAAAADDTQNRNREPTPQEAAARLLHERDRRNVGTLREQFRSVERAIALFVGSLVPGFGERHIAARDAAEAVRQAEAREREEARRREEDETARAETAERQGRTTEAQEAGEAQAPDQAAQAPLVEI